MKNLSWVVMPALVAMALTLGACAPEVGSDRWCTQMETEPKADWSMRDAADFTKHCVLNQKPE